MRGKEFVSESVRFSQERKFPEWLRTNSGAGRSENININRCQTTEKCSPTHRRPKRLLTGYMTPHPYSDVRLGGRGGRGWGRDRRGKRANYVAKWAT